MKHRYGYVYGLAVALIAAVLVGFDAAARASVPIQISAPANNATVSGPVTITLSINSPTSWADIYVDGTYLNSSPPFSFSWNSTTVSNGDHTISVTAFTTSGSNLGSSSITVNVQNAASSASSGSAVSISAPANGATVSGSVSITTPVSSSVSWTDLYIDGTYLTSGPPFTSTWNSTTVSNGSHTISVSAFSSSKAVIGSASSKVTVNNTAASSSPSPAPSSSSTPGPSDPTVTITGTTYYVDSAGGNDSNAGNSSSAPWQTIGKVMSELPNLHPGDGVLFKGGDVWTQQFDINGAVGTAANPIVFSSYGTGQPVLDEEGNNLYCIDAIGTAAKYLTFNNFECRHATEQGVTFKTNGGTMPGITVENFYIHNSGPGAYNSNSAIVGSDDGNYANQLDFEDFAQGADGVHFINNTVKWAGGHNCVEVHHDTGAVLVQGNTVGPGCVHVAVDVKGIGSPSTPASVTHNVATCGYSLGLCGCQGSSCNPTPSFYTENVYSPDETLTYSFNIAYDSAVGFQDCPGGCANGSGCAMNIKYYNNTAYIKSGLPSSFGIYASGTCDGSAVSSADIDVRNNIFDGSNVSITGMSAVTENYNDIGGAQGNDSINVQGSDGPNDLLNVNPDYVNASSSPPNFELQSGSPLINAGQSGLTSSNNIGAY